MDRARRACASDGNEIERDKSWVESVGANSDFGRRAVIVGDREGHIARSVFAANIVLWIDVDHRRQIARKRNCDAVFWREWSASVAVINGLDGPIIGFRGQVG